MNLHKLKKMIEKPEPWLNIHMEIFYQLFMFYCENAEPKYAFAFITKMNKISQQDISDTSRHTILEHLKIYHELFIFYKDNADPLEVQNLLCLILSHMRRLEKSKNEVAKSLERH